MHLTPRSVPSDFDITDRVWFSANEAADYTGMTAKTLRRALLDGRLRGVRPAPRTPGARPGRPRFRREWLDAFVAGETPARTA